MKSQGVLTLDHSHGPGINGEKRGEKQELDAVQCRHCERLIALFKKGTENHALANIDIGRATKIVQSLNDGRTQLFTCPRCPPYPGHPTAYLCRRCQLEMQDGSWQYLPGVLSHQLCPGPYKDRMMRAIEEHRARVALGLV